MVERQRIKKGNLEPPFTQRTIFQPNKPLTIIIGFRSPLRGCTCVRVIRPYNEDLLASLRVCNNSRTFRNAFCTGISQLPLFGRRHTRQPHPLMKPELDCSSTGWLGGSSLLYYKVFLRVQSKQEQVYLTRTAIPREVLFVRKG